MAKKRWISETLFEDRGFRIAFEAERVLHEARTPHQHLVLFRHRYFGKILMLDGATQVTTRDEFIYHEMMSHVALFAHGKAREVLVVGGGDCGIARQVLKHKSVRRLTQVEIDRSVVEFSRRHFAEFTGPVFADARFDLIIDDGMDFVTRTDRRFDVIIVDSTDPQGPGAVLFTRKFYAGCKRCLARGGVLVTQNGVPFFQPQELTTSMRHFRSLFDDAACFVAAIPTYVGGHMAMGWATDQVRLRHVDATTVARRYRDAGRFETRYWTPQVHCAAFALPRFIADAIAPRRRPARQS
ncbi:MAG: polyamine aminopropyltransferase [Proteobacteria bacterium]|nr:polyamine aminopropyltransferase [Pseudomonadota bacterium]